MSPSKRSQNKTSISFWITRDILEKWDAYCLKKNLSRTRLIIDTVQDKVIYDENLHDLSIKIDRLAEFVADFNPDAESLITESRRLNSRGRVLEQILITHEMGIRRENIKGLSSYALEAALVSLENDKIIQGDQYGKYWLKEYIPQSKQS